MGKGLAVLDENLSLDPQDTTWCGVTDFSGQRERVWILGFHWTASLAKARRGILGSMRDPISKTKAEMFC